MAKRQATERDLDGAVQRINQLIPIGVTLVKWNRNKYRVEGPGGTTPLGRTWKTPSDLYNQLWDQIAAIDVSRRR